MSQEPCFRDCRPTAQWQADSVIVDVLAIYQQRHSASWFLWGKDITARPFLHALRIQVNGVATIFLISDEQRVPSELQVANKQPLVVLFTPPELDSGVKHLHLPQRFSACLIGRDHVAVFAVALGWIPSTIGNNRCNRFGWHAFRCRTGRTEQAKKGNPESARFHVRYYEPNTNHGRSPLDWLITGDSTDDWGGVVRDSGGRSYLSAARADNWWAGLPSSGSPLSGTVRCQRRHPNYFRNHAPQVLPPTDRMSSCARGSATRCKPECISPAIAGVRCLHPFQPIVTQQSRHDAHSTSSRLSRILPIAFGICYKSLFWQIVACSCSSPFVDVRAFQSPPEIAVSSS